jgi:hypothetical protein
MVLRQRILAGLLLALIVSLGCSCATVRPVILHPIEKADIFRVEKDAKIVHTDGTKDTAEKDGYFLSEYYLEEVMKARVE